jgi:hypothetical protein
MEKDLKLQPQEVSIEFLVRNFRPISAQKSFRCGPGVYDYTFGQVYKNVTELVELKESD